MSKMDRCKEILIEMGKRKLNSEKIDELNYISFKESDVDKDDKIAANELINNIEEYPHAFVLACLMDRQIEAWRAWYIPHKIRKELNSFKIDKLLEKKLSYYEDLFKNNNLHRYNNKMPKVFYEALGVIKYKYEGDASKIWSGNPSSAKIVCRFLEFNGAGIKIASMATNLLVRDFKIPVKDKINIDVSPDRHIKRIFKRVGFTDENVSNTQIIYTARDLCPEYPGVFDYPAWELGTTCCEQSKPECEKCYLERDCPKIIN